MKLIKHIIFFLLFAAFAQLKAQTDVLVNQYMFNSTLYNPSATGRDNLFEASLLARQQWMGIEATPSTQMLNVHGLLNDIGGIGLSIVNDRLGLEKNLNIKLLYAHHFNLSRYSMLSLGAGAGIINRSVDIDGLIAQDDEDIVGMLNTETRMSPDFSFGAQYNIHGFSAGIASSHIQISQAQSNNFKMPRHYYANMAYLFNINKTLTIRPSIFVKSCVFITQYDLNTLFIFNKKLWMGASYRLNEAVTGIFGFKINAGVMFSYSFDYTLGPATLYNTNSHEIMVSFMKSHQRKRTTIPSILF